MERNVIQTKLEALARCISRIQSQKISSADELSSNFDKQDVVILNLQRAVQICVDIANHILLDYPTQTPSTMAESFKFLAQNKIISEDNAKDLSRDVGFRNIAVHQYENIDCNIIFSVITNHLEDFRTFAQFIAKLADF